MLTVIISLFTLRFFSKIHNENCKQEFQNRQIGDCGLEHFQACIFRSIWYCVIYSIEVKIRQRICNFKYDINVESRIVTFFIFTFFLWSAVVILRFIFPSVRGQFKQTDGFFLFCLFFRWVSLHWAWYKHNKSRGGEDWFWLVSRVDHLGWWWCWLIGKNRKTLWIQIRANYVKDRSFTSTLVVPFNSNEWPRQTFCSQYHNDTILTSGENKGK